MVALSNASQGYSFGDSIEKMMEHLPEIFLADKERYLAFLDPKTLEERVRKAPRGNLQGVFRTKDEFGRYSWKFHHVISVPDRSEKVFLYATRSFDIPSFYKDAALIDSDSFAPLVTGEKGNKDKSSEKEALFDDFMLHSPFPFFWKDRQRRFLGASQSFLDYYGFSSLDEILGKTDEDLHWHPENFTYRKDEEEVLSTGKVHIAIPGRCIARGVTRNILATKWPLLRDGKICGLMGYFIDENMVSSLLERERPSSKSKDPSLPIENFSDFLDDMARYR
jgi:PAS domain-containing protein